MKYGIYRARSRIGSAELALFALICWLLVIVQFASALQEAGGVRGKGIINAHARHDITLFHRRLESDSLEVERDRSDRDQLTPSTSIVSDHRIHDMIFGQPVETNELQKLIVGGSNAGIDKNDGPTTRIVGGSDAQDTRYPWFVRVLGVTANNNLSSCGGALVAPDMVITAAHCSDSVRVMVGAYNLQDIRLGIEDNMIRKDVIKLQRHPEYSPDQDMTIDYDVMLLKLEEPVLEMAPVRMNFDDNYPSQSGERLNVIGFGSVIGGPETGLPNGPVQSASILQEAPTDYVSFKECAVAKDPKTNQIYGTSQKNTVVQDYWLCTLRSDTSTCFGDSGGPVIKKGSDATNDLLVGVISGAVGYCGNPYLPLWNNRVSSHQDWIKEVGCELSTMPPSYWNCPGRDNDVLVPDPPIATPVASPIAINSPIAPPISSPIDSLSNFPTNFPTFSPAPTVSFAPTETPTSPDLIFYIAIGAGAVAVIVMGSVGVLMFKRRKNRIDDADQYSAKNDRKPSKPNRARHKKKKAKKEPYASSPETSIESDVNETPDSKDKGKGFFSRFATDKSKEEEASVDYVDPESQQNPDPAGEDSLRGDTLDVAPQDSEDSPNEVVKNSTDDKSRRRFFPSLFKARGKDLQEDEVDDGKEKPLQETGEALEDSVGQTTTPDINVEDVEDLSDDNRRPSLLEVGEKSIPEGTEIDAEGGQGMPLHGAGAAQETKNTQAAKAVYIPNDTASMVVQIDNESDDVAYDMASMVVQADNEYNRRPVNDFVFPRTYQQRTSGSISEDRAKSSLSNFDSAYDIKAVVYKGRDSLPKPSNSLDRTRAMDYANKQFDRIRPRSLSQERSRASSFAPQTNSSSPTRSRSMERSKASKFASDNNYYGPEEENSRSRGRSKERADARNFASTDSNRFRTRSDERSEASRLRDTRRRSRERSRANEFTLGERKSRGKSHERNYDPPGEVYANRLIRRSSSLDRSRANEFANSDLASDKYSGQRRSSSLDRSRATKFANNDSYGDNYTNQRRSSLDRSRATRFANDDSAGDKYTNQHRSSSLDPSRATNFTNRDSTGINHTSQKRSPPLDRSRATNFATGKLMSPNTISDSRQKRVSSPNAAEQKTTGARMVDNSPTSGAVITKNPDGSVVHAVKRRRADGALVTTKTKYANIRLARKYGVPI